MKHGVKTLILGILVFAVVIFVWFVIPIMAMSEEIDQTTDVYVTAKLLNGRARPSKKSTIEARFDKGDILQAIYWSDNHHWVEVIGGETGTVWVWWEYINEQKEEYTTWWNNWGSKVKIRKEPFGTVIGYLKNGGEVDIDRIVLGWGHTSKGWIDLRYLTEED